MRTPACFMALGFLLASLAVAAPPNAGPSRAAEKGCVWEKLSDAKIGLEAWVQRCDFGFRKISFLFVGSSLAVRYSDGGAPEPLVDVHSLDQGETPEAGVKRFFAARTAKNLVARCVSEPIQVPKSPPECGVSRSSLTLPTRRNSMPRATRARCPSLRVASGGPIRMVSSTSRRSLPAGRGSSSS